MSRINQIIWITLILPLPMQGQNLLHDKLIGVASDYISYFNATDNELYKQFIPNAEAEEFLKQNIPLFECPDKELEKTYYFRWWAYRKHIKKTPEGYVISEFLPDVPWAGKYNTISCAASHHFYEGRWLHNDTILSDYARFWFKGGGNPRLYSFGAANAIYNYCLVHADHHLLNDLYPALKENFAHWEAEKCDSTKLFWQTDDRDGMEMSISGKLSEGGKGYRPTINSYMYGEAFALSQIAAILHYREESIYFKKKADEIRQLINDLLWDKEDKFYKVIPKNGTGLHAPTREQLAYTPWFYNIPPKEYSIAWEQLFDEKGFSAPFGPTTAEQRSPDFKISYEGHECQWNGPSWPYSTSITLTALANYLNHYPTSGITKNDYYELLRKYSHSHHRITDSNDTICWIDENINPYTGDWISRTRLKQWGNGTWSASKGGTERGKDYNHSSFCDLIITGLIGIQPLENDSLSISPLIPDNKWEYFCLDNLPYQGKTITVIYDKTGMQYRQGKGFIVFVNNKVIKQVDTIQKTTISFPSEKM